MNPHPVIWSDNPSLKLVLPSTMTIKWINPTKSHYQGVYLPQSLYYGASGWSSFLPSFITNSSFPHLWTCPLLPPWHPVSYTSIFFKCAQFTGDMNREGIDPVAALPTPPPGSTVVVSLPEFVSAKTMTLMKLQWGGLSSLQNSTFLVAGCKREEVWA